MVENKKYLKITDLVFILPDDFDGNDDDAFQLMYDYWRRYRIYSNTIDTNTTNTAKSILDNSKNNSKRFCSNHTIIDNTISQSKYAPNIDIIDLKN